MVLHAPPSGLPPCSRPSNVAASICEIPAATLPPESTDAAPAPASSSPYGPRVSKTGARVPQGNSSVPPVPESRFPFPVRLRSGAASLPNSAAADLRYFPIYLYGDSLDDLVACLYGLGVVGAALDGEFLLEASLGSYDQTRGLRQACHGVGPLARRHGAGPLAVSAAMATPIADAGAVWLRELNHALRACSSQLAGAQSLCENTADFVDA
ncbi:hypothetical protein CYMTET_34244 [Cymbomonas tetramitiformis]|uniref:Uncharacterized protein n=1 Tax=Cymbomonas tetramitiformis TaxID=36881 RepID=A0AAE0FBF7_9CHLO|nr:hypothetical protein CYMTET_34244 [Cymbomonas tetramitiformis]